jgi:hypothetical protein
MRITPFMNLKKTVFMLKKLKRDLLKREYPFEMGPISHSQELREYYFLFYRKPQVLNWQIQGFDQDGIPLVASYIDVKERSLVYYPISIGQYALAVFHDFLKSGSEEDKQTFLKFADWFYENRMESETGTFWLTDVPRPEYKIAIPWKSAFAQSRALSVLLRAWQLTGNESYLTVSKRALLPFTHDISEGGVSAHFHTGYPFYEEYVADTPTMVLDGHFFALMGLLDFIRAVPPHLGQEMLQIAHNLFDQGIESLRYWLLKFDMGYWVRFNLCTMPHYPDIDPCSKSYMRLVLAQLNLFYRITGHAFLKETYVKWKKYDNLVNLLRMYLVKYRTLRKLNRI